MRGNRKRHVSGIENIPALSLFQIAGQSVLQFLQMCISERTSFWQAITRFVALNFHRLKQAKTWIVVHQV